MLSVISSTHATWQELNFGELQKTLESTLAELATNRERGETSRSELVQQTKEFKKNAPEDVRKAVFTLLRSFQMEVDASRKRCQFAEEAYVTVYKKLMDLPDPTLALAEVQSLQKRATRVMELEVELRKLKESNDQLKADSNALRSSEQENKRLQKLIDQMSNSVDSRVESEMTKLKEETDQMLMTKEHELILLKSETAERLSAMEDKCTSLTKALELAQSEVFKLKLQQDKTNVGRSSEVELLMDELDKAHVKIKDLEEALAAPGQGSYSSSTEADECIRQLRSRIEELESDLLDKDNENNVLTSALHKLRTENEQQSNSSEVKITELEQALSSATTQLAEAQKQLAEQSDYGEIARELAFLRSIEFPEEYDEVGCQFNQSYSQAIPKTDHSSDKKPPLEVLLMKKNRHLQNQIAELNAVKDQMTIELNQLRLYETEARQQTQEQGELIRLLESDLYRLQTALNEPGRMLTFQQSAVVAPVSPTQHQRGALRTQFEDNSAMIEHNNRREGQMLAEAMGEKREDEVDGEAREETDQMNGLERTISNTGGSGANMLDTSLIQIVQHQRDRFRARAEELEQAEASVRQHLTSVQRELEAVRADNVKLYEKIRFLQSYSSPVGSRSEMRASVPTSNQSTDRVSVQLGSDPTLLKYSQAYEAHMDPFNQFSRQEKQRVYQDLKPYEKVMLRIGRLVLGNRRARFMAFTYALVIHILIFLALYNAAYFQKSAADAEASCLSRYAEHMRAAHPEMPQNHKF